MYTSAVLKKAQFNSSFPERERYSTPESNKQETLDKVGEFTPIQ